MCCINEWFLPTLWFQFEFDLVKPEAKVFGSAAHLGGDLGGIANGEEMLPPRAPPQQGLQCRASCAFSEAQKGSTNTNTVLSERPAVIFSVKAVSLLKEPKLRGFM